MALKQSGTTIVSDVKLFSLGTATPASPSTGLIRYNSTSTKFEVYDGTAWVEIVQQLPTSSPLYGWGFNGSGQLGDNTTVGKSSPVSAIGGHTDWTQVSAGFGNSVGLQADGTIWTWGGGGGGQLGSNSIASRLSPAEIVGGITNWIQVAAGGGGGGTVTALRADGTAWAWGDNSRGQLGINNVGNRSSPVSVVGGYTDWIQISAGGDHIAGLRANGTIWCWGANNYGQCATGVANFDDISSPVSIVGGINNWVHVAAGGAQTTLAIKSDGTAWSWGSNYRGLLGNNDSASVYRSSPVSVLGGFTDWLQISVNAEHVLGLRANGTAWSWGRGLAGMLGDGTTIYRSSPVSVVGGFTDWTQVSAGYRFSIAVRANGTAWSWGDNSLGKLGVNTNSVLRSSPVSVVGGFTDWVQVAAGISHSLGLRAV